jgi:hypothetical protein
MQACCRLLLAPNPGPAGKVVRNPGLFFHDFRANDGFLKSLIMVCNLPVSIEKRVFAGGDLYGNDSTRGYTLDVDDLGFN